jgi:hypothetical protein
MKTVLISLFNVDKTNPIEIVVIIIAYNKSIVSLFILFTIYCLGILFQTSIPTTLKIPKSTNRLAMMFPIVGLTNGFIDFVKRKVTARPNNIALTISDIIFV